MGDGAVARVCVDSPLPHLDRLFDYSVPEALLPIVRVGTRVRVPFSRRLVSGVVCEVAEESDFGGRLLAIRSSAAIHSTTQDGIMLAQAVARRYGGSLWDVLRLAIPPRVLAVEKRWLARGDAGGAGERSRLPRGPKAGIALGAGDRVLWEALPEPPRTSVPADTLVGTALDVAQRGGSIILLVPDARAIAALEAGFVRAGLSRWNPKRGGGDVAIIRAEDGAATRYDNYLAAMMGAATIVIGTRATAFQPVPRLSALLMWDDGNPGYLDPHAPYPHARTVAALRAGEEVGEDAGERPALLFGSWAPSIEAAALGSHGWARWEAPSRDSTREETPVVEVVTEARRESEGGRGRHWMPGAAWTSATKALERGPVAVVVPRAGYVGAVACAACGEWAECLACAGSLAVGARGADPVCVDCGQAHPQWHCPSCHGAHLKEALQGVERVAEQMRRMAPTVTVAVSSAATGVLRDGVVKEGFVVATPGALPAVKGGYAAAVIVGADSGLGRSGTEVDAVRRWLGVGVLVRSRAHGGRLVLIGDFTPDVRRALETWTPGELARAVSAERAALGLPPHRRVVRLEGSPALLARVSSVVVGQASLGSRPDITAMGESPGRVTYLCPRDIAQVVIDGAREIQREASLHGEGELHLRVDGSLVLGS